MFALAAAVTPGPISVQGACEAMRQGCAPQPADPQFTIAQSAADSVQAREHAIRLVAHTASRHQGAYTIVDSLNPNSLHPFDHGIGSNSPPAVPPTTKPTAPPTREILIHPLRELLLLPSIPSTTYGETVKKNASTTR